MSWAIAIPSVVVVVCFHVAAPLSAAWYSLTDWNGLGTAHWIGLANFRNIFANAVTRGALEHSLVLAGVLVVTANVLGCFLAITLNRTLKTRYLLRSLFFAPFVLSPLATSYIWQYIFTYDGGFNRLLQALGLGSWQRPWLGDPTWAIWTVAVVLVWQFSGLSMVIFLAGLQAIPQEIDEAAAVDGATSFRRFRKITLPLLAPAVTVSSTLTLIFGLRVFDQVIALTGGGPVNATETLSTQVWEETFAFGKFGYGAALSIVLSLLVAVLVGAQLLVMRSRELRL